MVGKRLTNALSDCIFLLREGNRLYISGKKIKSKYDEMEQMKSRDYERKNGDREGENRDCKR